MFLIKKTLKNKQKHKNVVLLQNKNNVLQL